MVLRMALMVKIMHDFFILVVHPLNVNGQFNYCTIIWMFCRKKLKLKLEKIHTRVLRSVLMLQVKCWMGY